MTSSDAAPLYAIDTEFCHAIMRAAKVFHDMGSKLQASAADGGDIRPLVDWLLSNRALEAGERRELAGLLSGEFSRPRGRSSRKYEVRDERRKILDRYNLHMAELKSQHVSPRQSKAIEIVVAEFPKSAPTRFARLSKIRKCGFNPPNKSGGKNRPNYWGRNPRLSVEISVLSLAGRYWPKWRQHQ